MSRKFAAKYQYKWQGWVCVAFGVVFLRGISSPEISNQVLGVILGLGLLALGIFLLRGQGESPAQAARSKAKADLIKSQINGAKALLAGASGGAAVVAFRKLDALVTKAYPETAVAELNTILEEIGFDVASMKSHFIGNVPLAGWGKRNVEIYKDYIIVGEESFDVDVSTRAEVHVDGAITYDQKNNKIDNRTASIQFVSTDWSTSFKIAPDTAPAARTLASQLMAVIESLKPKGVSAADISDLVKTLVKNTGQPAAQKLQQLSDLRYQRLLTDEEFEAAKAKVLGL